ncbi:hypothetical protein GAY29_08190 [Azospirillum brasilense]|uniref:TRADD-N-associated membrane domain-containing protein n=1 Tax=Azospirillum brasilense TaxID=192 RepID=UPI00190D815D|nr:hypothetical protein [Azospirillum brasilense]MBK3733090.1 hypothetical protein [Azospirillum brasilense]
MSLGESLIDVVKFIAYDLSSTLLSAVLISSVIVFAFGGFLKKHFQKIELNYDMAGSVNGGAASSISNDAQISNFQAKLVEEYHAQGISQSKISFAFSLVFAAVGFILIASAVIIFLFQNNGHEASLADAAKPAFALVSGTIIDAVSALFFVQSNKSRQLMTEFFDKLRIDRKLDESLKLASEIEDWEVKARLKSLLSLNFASIEGSEAVMAQIFARSFGSVSQAQDGKGVKNTASGNGVLSSSDSV